MPNNNKNYMIGIVLIIIVIIALVVFTGHKGVTTDTNTTATTTGETPNNSVPSKQTSGKTTTGTQTTVTPTTPENTTAPVVTQPAPAGTPAVTHSINVNYTESGFSPTSLVINRGDTVVFVNQSANFMWVAGFPNQAYPQTYPGFDEGKQVSNGGTYSITFNQTGDFQYYNENHVSSVGHIIVQ